MYMLQIIGAILDSLTPQDTQDQADQSFRDTHTNMMCMCIYRDK
jgi:hypothetical protein